MITRLKFNLTLKIQSAKMNTRKSSLNLNETKAPSTPKSVSKPTKLSVAQLQDKVEQLESLVNQMMADSAKKDKALEQMEIRILQLEMDEMKNASYLTVQKNVSDLLAKRVAQLEQYTRRYSVVISGLDRSKDETHASLQEQVNNLLTEAGSTSSMNDVDKFHRNGPRRGADQEVIVRFKSHYAKEAFYKKRKNITAQKIKVKPSLSAHSNTLLKEARDFIDHYTESPENYDNPPLFVCPNVHGNLLVKLAKDTDEGTSFYQFDSIQKLYEIITKFNDVEADLEFDEISSLRDPKGMFPRLPRRILTNLETEQKPTSETSEQEAATVSDVTA